VSDICHACGCRTVVLRKDRFDEREEDFYEAMYTQSQAQFDAYVESGTLLNNYSHVFDLLIKLRQACGLQPYLYMSYSFFDTCWTCRWETLGFGLRRHCEASADADARSVLRARR